MSKTTKDDTQESLNDIKLDKDGNWVIEMPNFFTSAIDGIKRISVSCVLKTQEQLENEQFEAFLKENERRLKETP